MFKVFLAFCIASAGLFSDSPMIRLQGKARYWICYNEQCTNYQHVYHSTTGRCPVCRVVGVPG